jgi:hypothetical protein
MSFRSKRLLTTIAALIVLSSISPTVSASASDSCVNTDARFTGQTTSLKPGDMVRDYGAAAVVPPRGTTVWTDVILTTGGSEELGVRTDVDGTVTVYCLGDESTVSGPAVSSSPADCDDPVFNLKPYRWLYLYEWRYQSSSKPSYLPGPATLQALRDAAVNITHATNLCGHPDNVSATSNYLGTTSVDTGISNLNACLGADSDSVTGFGNLDGALGTACTYSMPDGSGGDFAFEGDVKLNKFDGVTWYISGVTSCSGDWSVEAVATHERGHTFGLAHVSEDTHGNLTMSTDNNGTCQNQESNLGKGDWLGLEFWY